MNATIKLGAAAGLSGSADRPKKRKTAGEASSGVLLVLEALRNWDRIMNISTSRDSIRSFPRNFSAKNGKRLRLQLLDQSLERRFVERYLAFQPRNSFQGLPPLKDEVCAKWAEEMISTGINLVAICPREGIVGHAALFPIDRYRCELLLVVWPQYQNLGIGTALTEGCVQVADELGFRQIWLPVDATNLRARHIYAKCGFEYASQRQSRELDMVCDIARSPAKIAGKSAPSKESAIPIPRFLIDAGTMAAEMETMV
jgi:RimJ/RimL family protein N-acetyltransferase